MESEDLVWQLRHELCFNLSGVDYRKEGIRLKKLIEDMAACHITIIIDAENEATRFVADNGRFDACIPWEFQPQQDAKFLSYMLRDGSQMPYGCQL